MRKHTVMLSALVAAFASFAAPFTDGGVTYTPNDEVTRRQPVVTGVNVTGMVESVAYTKGEVDRRIETNAPVRSVNGMRGNVKLGAREVGALPDNRAYLEDDANFVNAVRNVQLKAADTSHIERVVAEYDATNLTPRISAKADLYTEWVFSSKPELCRNPSVSRLPSGMWCFSCQLKFNELDSWNDYLFYSAIQDEPPLHFELVFGRHANRQKAVYSDGLNAKRDRTDNISHENSDAAHWEIVEHPMPEYSPLDPEPTYNGTEWQWRSTSPTIQPYSYIYADGGPDATELMFFNFPYSSLIIRAVKRVTRVATEGRTFVTDDVIREMIKRDELEETVNRVKDLHYDAGLSVTWTNIVDNGHIYYVTVTNTNIVTP